MKKAACVCMLLALMITGCARESYIEKGLEQLQDTKYEEAIETFEKSIEKEADIASAYRGLGIAYWELEQYKEAKTAFQSALSEGAKRTGTIYNFLGICEMKEENYQEALDAFSLGLAAESESSEVMREMEFNQIVCYEKLYRWEDAKVKIAEYVEKYPDDEKALKEAEFLSTR